jgi:hypothetical protein
MGEAALPRPASFSNTARDARETEPPRPPPHHAWRWCRRARPHSDSTPRHTFDVIGAGNFARTMLLPHLQGRVPLGTVVNNTALSTNHVRTKFGFAGAATNSEQLFADEGAAAVLIATRHNLHAPLVLRALEANRHVFVEKPLCLTRASWRKSKRTGQQPRQRAGGLQPPLRARRHRAA